MWVSTSTTKNYFHTDSISSHLLVFSYLRYGVNFYFPPRYGGNCIWIFWLHSSHIFFRPFYFKFGIWLPPSCLLMTILENYATDYRRSTDPKNSLRLFPISVKCRCLVFLNVKHDISFGGYFQLFKLFR